MFRGMKVAVDAHFAVERAALAFRFTCEACVYHDPGTDSCAHEWPGGLPGGAHRDATVARDDMRWLLFCKEFELA